MSKIEIPKNLTEEQIKFWLANTELTREQLIQWYTDFNDFAHKNQKLDKENFVNFFKKLHHKKKDGESFYRLAFDTFDKDESGFIDFHEFVVSFNLLSNGDIKSRLEWVFDVYDQNNDKAIDRKEIQVITKAILKMNKKKLVGDQTDETKIDEIFEKLDDNENDEITKEEFVENCLNNVFLRDLLVPNL
ncbi:unnamed protein product [Brachionus calyciflorus]|uniref:EF-hand domain-containing protein n=1 Tax=Brachionus calyciflorus TaxID=104777 RepID=A0A813RFK6_9BILA|nr:unnamed protein product [Brachionus calyciflorus]